MELQDVLAAVGASAALAGVFLLTLVAIVSTWSLSRDLRRGQQDFLHSLGRIEGLVSGLAPERETRPREREGGAEVAPTDFSQQLKSVSEQMQRLREAVRTLSESRVSEVREVTQVASEMESTLKRLETAVALMADGVAAFIQKLEGGRGQTQA